MEVINIWKKYEKKVIADHERKVKGVYQYLSSNTPVLTGYLKGSLELYKTGPTSWVIEYKAPYSKYVMGKDNKFRDLVSSYWRNNK